MADARVREVHRYPIKSLRGEQLEGADVDVRGLVGDRRWAVVGADGRFGSGKTSRRFVAMPGLLDLVASDGEASRPTVTFPDGRRAVAGAPGTDEAVSAHLGRPVRLAEEADVSHFDDGPVHLVTTAALATASGAYGAELPLARFRANLLLEVPGVDGVPEEAWIGHEVALGDVLVLRILAPQVRCVMVDMPQRDLPSAPGVLSTLGRINGATLGVLAEVVTPGRVAVGDPVHVR